MVRFFVIFIVCLVVLFRIDMLDSFQQSVAEPWAQVLAAASANIMMLWDSDVAFQGKIIMSKATGFAVSIEAGCNGIEAAIVLFAGVMAFPSTAVQKFIGVVFGFLVVQIVNLLRIISLYYLGQFSESLFEFSHLYLWQALIMLDVLIFWILWVRWVSKERTFSSLDAGHAS